MPTDVLTYKYDTSRTGANTTESVLTLANVNSSQFGVQRILAVDGAVDAQPLYLSKLTISGQARNVVFVATEHDSVYALDADSGATIWHASLLATGETTSDTHGCFQVSPEIGVTATPVIDRSAGIIYVVAMSKAGTTYHQRLHALDVTSGAEQFSGPTEISATYPTANGGSLSFDPYQYEERAALLLANGLIYTSWTSHCDSAPYSGWIITFDAKSLARTSTLNVAPNSGEAGPAIWMAGGGPAADSAGNVFLLTANGVFETVLDHNGFPNLQDYGNSFLKIALNSGTLSVADYFTMSDEVAESNSDTDLGSGGVLLLPDLKDSAGTVRHLAVGAGKDGRIYVVNRDSMGKFNSQADNIWQELQGALGGGVYSTPAYFNGTLYYGDAYATLKAFAMSNAMLVSQPSSQSAVQFTYPGTAASVSANGTANAIVWAHENATQAVLHAFDAGNLAHELYNSTQAGSRDAFGAGNKFITPVVADGRVFVGTKSGLAIFGPLH
jgi:outer membrane protein assembly factor BamB